MIFKPAARYPADPRAVFILALSVFSGITAFALEVAPDSLHALLPDWAVFVWGALLTLGSVVTLAGMIMPTVNGILIEQVGSVMVAATTIFYSVLALWTTGLEAIQVIGLVLAWGLACAIRWGQLQILIHDSVRRAQKIAFLQHLEAEVIAHEARRGHHIRRGAQ